MKFIELFAGIGGFRYGLEKVGQIQPLLERFKDSKQSQSNRSRPQFTCVWANEIDKYACQIYRKNFGEGELYEGDIRTVQPEDIPEAEMLVGGFPCQAFSIAGKRKGFEDTRGTLFYEIARLARINRYKVIFLENVKGLLSHEQGDTLATIFGVLDDLGYDVQWQVLNSKNFGVPQNRERVFIIGHLRGESRPKVFPIGESNQEPSKRIEVEMKYRNQKTVYNPDGISPTFRNGHGDGVRIKVHNMQPRSGNPNKGGTGHLTKENGPAYCLDGGRTNAIEKDMTIRRLTPCECERLQGFPDGWTEGISDTQRYKCLGNEVTTNVIQAIGEKL